VTNDGTYCLGALLPAWQRQATCNHVALCCMIHNMHASAHILYANLLLSCCVLSEVVGLC